ncbi:MAG: hypothetical protein DDT32_01490 [Syntrophomonadaceae bacterium]|nr:hypothetical protein [Bacillota bacterium]
MLVKSAGLKALFVLIFISLIGLIASLKEDHQLEAITPLAVYVPHAARPGANAWTFAIDFISETPGTFVIKDVLVADVLTVHLAHTGPTDTRLPDAEPVRKYIVLEPLERLAVGEHPVVIHINFQPNGSSDLIPVIAETVFYID